MPALRPTRSSRPDRPADAASAAASPARPRVRRGNTEDAEQLRSALVAAAMALFNEAGLGGVSIRAVAARVGVSPMSTYRYFADKAELMTGLWTWVMQGLCDEMRSAVLRARGARGRHRALIESFLGYWTQHPDQYCLVYGFQLLGKPRDAKAPGSSAPVYAELLELGNSVTERLAEEIGGDATRVKLANDVRVAMMLGYLHGTLVSTRYPWSDTALLHRAYVGQIEQSVERILAGPAAPALRR